MIALLRKRQEYHQLKNKINETEKNSINVCPNCGYAFDEEIYDVVRSDYKNEEYMCQQIKLIIESINEELVSHKE